MRRAGSWRAGELRVTRGECKMGKREEEEKGKNNRIKLAVFDMEGCLTDDPTVWEIMHRKRGTWESHGLRYWEQYRAGELDYDTFARMDVEAWGRAPVELLDAAAREVPLMAGCTELLAGLRAGGVRVAIVSNGLMDVAERFRREFGVTHVLANRIVTEDGRLTGAISIDVPYEGKGAAVRALAGELGLRRGEIAAVGDSRSDIAMFREAGLAVAFRPGEEAVSAAATHTVREKDLRAVLGIVVGEARRG